MLNSKPMFYSIRVDNLIIMEGFKIYKLSVNSFADSTQKFKSLTNRGIKN